MAAGASGHLASRAQRWASQFPPQLQVHYQLRFPDDYPTYFSGGQSDGEYWATYALFFRFPRRVCVPHGRSCSDTTHEQRVHGVVLCCGPAGHGCRPHAILAPSGQSHIARRFRFFESFHDLSSSSSLFLPLSPQLSRQNMTAPVLPRLKPIAFPSYSSSNFIPTIATG
jgi:hypothetical protein